MAVTARSRRVSDTFDAILDGLPSADLLSVSASVVVLPTTKTAKIPRNVKVKQELSSC